MVLTGILPATTEPTGWKPFFHDSRDGCLPDTAARVRGLSLLPPDQLLDADQHDRAHGHHRPRWWFGRQRHGGSNVASGGPGSVIAGFSLSLIQSRSELSDIRQSQRRIRW